MGSYGGSRVIGAKPLEEELHARSPSAGTACRLNSSMVAFAPLPTGRGPPERHLSISRVGGESMQSAPAGCGALRSAVPAGVRAPPYPLGRTAVHQAISSDTTLQIGR